MRNSLVLVLSIAIIGAVFNSKADAAGSTRENQRLQAGKITKNEAEHLVLKQYPGAKVTHCVLTPGKQHSIWVMDVLKAGASTTVKVQVDGRSGAIVP